MEKLTAKKMDTRGAQALASAILLRAAEDYYMVCQHPIKAPDGYAILSQGALRSRYMLEKFIDSEFFDIISPIDSGRFRKTIQNLKERHIPFPKNIMDARRT